MSKLTPGGIAARRRAGVVPITFVNAGAIASAISGANPSFAYPASLQADDFLWLPVSANVTTLWATNAVSGWTRRFAIDSSGVVPTIAGYYKWATGAEAGSISANSPGGSSIGAILAYRNVDKNNPFDDADQSLQSSASITAYTIPAQTASVAGAAALLVACGNSGTGSWNALTNYNERFDTNNTNAQVICIEDRLSLAIGTTGARSLVRSAGIRGCAQGVLLKPKTA